MFGYFSPWSLIVFVCFFNAFPREKEVVILLAFY